MAIFVRPEYAKEVNKFFKGSKIIGYVKKGIGKGMISNVAEQCDKASRNSKVAFSFSPLGMSLGFYF